MSRLTRLSRVIPIAAALATLLPAVAAQPPAPPVERAAVPAGDALAAARGTALARVTDLFAARTGGTAEAVHFLQRLADFEREPAVRYALLAEAAAAAERAKAPRLACAAVERLGSEF